MSLRFIPEYDEDGNVINPEFFVSGTATFAEEINGGLDRDNYPQANFSESELDMSPDSVFTTAHPLATDTDYTPDLNNTGRQGGTAIGASGIGYLQWTSVQEAHVDVQFGLTWTWGGATWSLTDNGAARPDTETYVNVVTFIGTVDGQVVFTLGPFEDALKEESTYGCGSIQLDQGTHTFSVWCVVQRIVCQTGAAYDISSNALTIGPRCGVVMEFQR